jgi:hypothetical protein
MLNLNVPIMATPVKQLPDGGGGPMLRSQHISPLTSFIGPDGSAVNGLIHPITKTKSSIKTGVIIILILLIITTVVIIVYFICRSNNKSLQEQQLVGFTQDSFKKAYAYGEKIIIKPILGVLSLQSNSGASTSTADDWINTGSFITLTEDLPSQHWSLEGWIGQDKVTQLFRLYTRDDDIQQVLSLGLPNDEIIDVEGQPVSLVSRGINATFVFTEHESPSFWIIYKKERLYLSYDNVTQHFAWTRDKTQGMPLRFLEA